MRYADHSGVRNADAGFSEVLADAGHLSKLRRVPENGKVVEVLSSSAHPYKEMVSGKLDGKGKFELESLVLKLRGLRNPSNQT